MIHDKIKDTLKPIPPDCVRVNGKIGSLMRDVTEARYLSERAEREVLAEAVNAFRNRVDDRLKPGRGLWQGEFWGKWVLGAAAACRYTGEERLRSLIAQAVDTILETQDDDGYIGTYSDHTFGQCDEDIFEWNIWCRKYTLWGLVEAYEILDDERILDGAVRFMEHLSRNVGPGAFDIRRTGAKYGMPSMSIIVPVLLLYRHTEEPKYLEYARYIIDQFSLIENMPPDIFNKALTGRHVMDWFPEIGPWAKAYEFLSCVEGMVELYRVTGERNLLTAAENVFASIRKTDLHITGGLGNNDTLGMSRFLVQAPAEVCDAVHWVRLAVQLLSLTGSSVYADDIERTLFNTFLTATGLDPFWGTRRLLLYGAHFVSPEHCELKTHHCCVANLPRGLYQAAETAVMQSDTGPVIQTCIPGSYQFGLPDGSRETLVIDTDYPETGSVRLNTENNEPAEFEMMVRIPPWSNETLFSINGSGVSPDAASGYAHLKRTWHRNDILEITFDMTGRITPLPCSEGSPEQPFAAFERGPVVLARDIRLDDKQNIHSPVLPDSDGSGRVELKRRDAPESVWMAFEAPLIPDSTNGSAAVSLCDYSSAGNTWDVSTSDFRVWLPLEVRDPAETQKPQTP